MTGIPAEQTFERAAELLRCMRVSEAALLFTQAEAAGFDPDSCSAGRWECHMLAGDFEAAWSESDLISGRGNADPNRFWDGQPIDDRRVLIRCLHGLGDTIQYIRYAPLIRERAKRLVLEVQPSLKKLIAESDLADDVITWGEPEPPWDQQIEVVELPRIFRTTRETIPRCTPYQKIEKSRDARKGTRDLRIGLVWASSIYNPARSIALEQLEPLLDVRGSSFFSFQAGPEREQLKPYSHRVADLYDPSGCVLAAAKNIQSMDLVITVDTMMAHLAGAVGCRVWTLLPYECDWRWMMNRDDSPWYPTMRLFRQVKAGDWTSVVERVRQDCKSLPERMIHAMNHWSPGFEHHFTD